MMTEKDWGKFFDLLEKIVHQEGLSQVEKAAAVKAAAAENGERAEMNLEEFLAWDFGF